MKKTILLIIVGFLFFACSKENGKISYKISYKNSTEILNSNFHETSSKGKTVSSDRYTGFGDYITSLTPDIFTAKFQSIRFHDGDYIIGGHLMELIDGNTSQDDPRRSADFTNGSSVSLEPVLYGETGNDGLFTDKEIEFIYFLFGLQYFYQEVRLPVQYKDLDLLLFNQSFYGYEGNFVKIDNVLKVDNYPFMKKIFEHNAPNDNTIIPLDYVFGNTDSSFVSFNIDPDVQKPQGDIPTGIGGPRPVIRSNKYNTFVLNSPLEGETITVNTTLSFNSNDLIQVYCGNDKIPYTNDDVFVYAPGFWERMTVSVSVE